MESYRGKVNGIDAQATPGMPLRCQAFINQNMASYIQVTTIHHILQSALELACIKGCEVEVSYNDNGGEKFLTRVRLLDR